MDNTNENIEITDDTVEVKKSLLRKVLIITGATAGLIIAGALFARTSTTDEDSETTDDAVIVTPVVSKA